MHDKTLKLWICSILTKDTVFLLKMHEIVQ